jgi:hypothetical protein
MTELQIKPPMRGAAAVTEGECSANKIAMPKAAPKDNGPRVSFAAENGAPRVCPSAQKIDWL